MAHSEPAEANSATKLDLNVPHIVASALAALSVTVLSSRFGINGTLIGAAVGSVIATISTSVYEHGIRRTGHRIKRVRSSVGGTHVEAEKVRFPMWERLPWKRIGVTAVIVFAIVLGTLTGVEASIKRSLSSLLTGQMQRSSTTLGDVTGIGASPAPTFSATPSITPTPTPSDEASPSSSPTTCPSSGDLMGPAGDQGDQGDQGPCVSTSAGTGFGPSPYGGGNRRHSFSSPNGSYPAPGEQPTYGPGAGSGQAGQSGQSGQPGGVSIRVGG